MLRACFCRTLASAVVAVALTSAPPAAGRSRLSAYVRAPQPYAVLSFDWEARGRLERRTPLGPVRVRWDRHEQSRSIPDSEIT